MSYCRFSICKRAKIEEVHKLGFSNRKIGDDSIDITAIFPEN